jgi:hypothetical protein
MIQVIYIVQILNCSGVGFFLDAVHWRSDRHVQPNPGSLRQRQNHQKQQLLAFRKSSFNSLLKIQANTNINFIKLSCVSCRESSSDAISTPRENLPVPTLKHVRICFFVCLFVYLLVHKQLLNISSRDLVVGFAVSCFFIHRSFGKVSSYQPRTWRTFLSHLLPNPQVRSRWFTQ